MPSLLHQYEQALATHRIRPDPQQRHAAQALDRLLQEIAGAAPPPAKRFFGLFRAAQPTASAGLYLWGDVGRGKSMLMDMFVDIAKTLKKTRRIHFHAFMLEVHKRLFVHRQSDAGEALEKVIREIADDTEVLCLDEFQVSDVADAMILARLFAGLMDRHVVTVFTSNRPPRALYQGGLQREQFMKFVAILEQRVEMVELNGPEDYRLTQMKALARSYIYPRDGVADDFLLESWCALTGDAGNDPLKLANDGRVLYVEKQAHGIAWFTFGELCKRPLGASDYLMIARLFHTVILQGIPQMTAEDRNEAKRFVTLIDALYDHRVKLIASAECPPDMLYRQGDGTFEFHRTVSRLMEMQSEDYLALPHIG